MRLRTTLGERLMIKNPTVGAVLARYSHSLRSKGIFPVAVCHLCHGTKVVELRNRGMVETMRCWRCK